MLNGIGGRTIEEAKSCMGYREYLTWCAFRKRRGPLHVGTRLDSGFALLASMYANAHSKHGGYKVNDFAPFTDEPEVDLDTAMETWT